MAYRRRDKPPFAAWLAGERARHDMKAEEVARRLRKAGFQAEDSTYRTWEAGRRPAPETVAALERLFGSAAPGDDETTNGDLARAILSLTEELAAWRRERAEMAQRLDDLEATVARLVVPVLDVEGSGGRPGPASPPVTTA